MSRRFVCVAMSVLLVWSGLASTADTQHEIHSHIDSVYQLASELEAMLDHSQYDLDALLESLDYDDKLIIDFVRQEIAFQAYEGVLRGPQGTLISRSGNALDQSLLLARLLKDAGYDARIARGKLQRDQGEALVQSMAVDTNWPSPFRDDSELHQILNLVWDDSSYTAESAQQETLKYVEEASPGISTTLSTIDDMIKAVQSALTPLASKQYSLRFVESLVEEQRDYFWVEYRLAEGGGWEAAHPAFGMKDAPQLQVSDYFTEGIPDELQHRVRVEVFIETRLGGETRTVPLMSPWERPAANVVNVPQVLTLAPVSEFEKEGKLDIEAGLSSATFYAPYLNGVLAPAASVFSLEGLVGPPEALSGQGAFVGTVAKKGLAAADAVANLGADMNEVRSDIGLNRLWFKFSIIAPDGDITAVTRDVLQTSEKGEKFVNGRKVENDQLRAALQAAFLQSREIAVATGPLAPAYSMAKGLSLLRETEQSIQALRDLQNQGDLVPTPEIVQKIKPPPDSRAFRFMDLANSATGNSVDGASYLAQPMIVTFNRGVSIKTGGLSRFKQTDIVFNARRSLEFGTPMAGHSMHQAVSRGVWDTYFEVLSARTSEEPVAQNSAFERLASEQGVLRYISPSAESALAELGLDTSAMLLARNELQAGYGLLVPGNMSAGDPAWWRVDADTGTVTGMAVGPGGYGGQITMEHIIKGFSLYLTGFFLADSLLDCYENEEGLALFCCLLDSQITGALVALLTYVTSLIVVELFATTGTVIIPGAAPGAGEIAKQNSRVFGNLVAYLTTGPGRTAAKRGKFRITVCGSITGT